MQGGSIPLEAIYRAAVRDTAMGMREGVAAANDGTLDVLIGRDPAVRAAVATSAIEGTASRLPRHTGVAASAARLGNGTGAASAATGSYVDGLRRRAVLGPWHARLVALGIAK